MEYLVCQEPNGYLQISNRATLLLRDKENGNHFEKLPSGETNPVTYPYNYVGSNFFLTFRYNGDAYTLNGYIPEDISVKDNKRKIFFLPVHVPPELEKPCKDWVQIQGVNIQFSRPLQTSSATAIAGLATPHFGNQQSQQWQTQQPPQMKQQPMQQPMQQQSWQPAQPWQQQMQQQMQQQNQWGNAMSMQQQQNQWGRQAAGINRAFQPMGVNPTPRSRSRSWKVRENPLLSAKQNEIQHRLLATPVTKPSFKPGELVNINPATVVLPKRSTSPVGGGASGVMSMLSSLPGMQNILANPNKFGANSDVSDAQLQNLLRMAERKNGLA